MEVLRFPGATSVIAIQSLFAAWMASLRSSAFNGKTSLRRQAAQILRGLI